MDTSQRKVAIVAAMEREVWPLIKHWRKSERTHDGRRYRLFETDRAVLVCGGIGAEAARRATEAIIQLFAPIAVISVGFAGSLDSRLPVGMVFGAKQVIDAADGSRIETAMPQWTLVSHNSVADAEQKKKLADAYGANAVDMEAAAVARGARAHGVRFLVFKAISDEMDFAMPPLRQFVSHDGQFHAGRFAMYALLRPWLWPSVIRLARNCTVATKALCAWLAQYNRPAPPAGEPGIHPRLRTR